LYRHLKEKLTQFYKIDKKDVKLDEDGIANFPDLELINLSTHVLPCYRLRRINRIKNGNGGKSKKRKVIVTTQLIEAGVDISVDIVYRDFAPLDCLIQTAGRCNRNSERDKGYVNVVILRDKKRELYKYIYDSTLIDATIDTIETFGEIVEEKDFILNSINKYYKTILERGSKDDSRGILESIIRLDFSKTAEFDLIQEKLPTMSLFVEIDEVAEEIRKKMEKIMDSKKGFERDLEILDIKREMNNYTLQIRCSEELENTVCTLNPIDGLEDYRYIERDELDKYYKIDLGLDLGEESRKALML
ncbi:MAG: hypothetical protein DRN18_01375, partial [Thermoplasmata archaeon]